MMNIRLTAIPMIVVGLLAGSASALTVGATGTVTDWNITPFTQPNGTSQTNGVLSTIADDYAPIDFPNYGYVPSPGGSRGETFDIEEMHVRVVGDRLDVLMVNSGGFEQEGFLLGDLFVTTNLGQVAVIGDPGSRGYNAGDVVAVTGASDVNVLQDRSGSYLNKNTLVANEYGPAAKIRDIAGPWQVVDGLAGQVMPIAATVSSTTFDYGGDEDGTHLIEYSIYMPGLGSIAGDGILLHQAWGCGNDVIKSQFVAGPGTPIPTPTGGMAIAGLISTLIMRRRR